MPLSSDIIVNAIIIIYPQSNDISSIISINFTTSGTYINKTLNMTSEQLISLNEPTIQVLVPVNSSSLNSLECVSSDGGSWQSNGCAIVKVFNASVLIEVSTNSMFKLIVSSSKQRNYIPIIISGIIILVLIIGFIILFKIEQKYKLIGLTEKTNPESTNRFYKILSYHILLGFFVKDKYLYKSERLNAYLSILSAGLVIEGGLIVSSRFNDNTGSLALIGFIASLCTLSINIIVNILKRIKLNKAYLLTVFLFFIIIVSLCITIALSLTLGLNNHSDWGICFGWGILFNIVLDFLPAITLDIIFIKSKKEFPCTKNKSLDYEKEPDDDNIPSIIINPEIKEYSNPGKANREDAIEFNLEYDAKTEKKKKKRKKKKKTKINVSSDKEENYVEDQAKLADIKEEEKENENIHISKSSDMDFTIEKENVNASRIDESKTSDIGSSGDVKNEE